MSNMIDLTKLAQETIDIKFADDVIFTIPIEPTLHFSTKMILYKEKMKKAKSEQEQLKLLSEIVTFILSQDESHDNVSELVGKMSPSQVEAVFTIYDNQVEQNKANPNS